MGGEVDLAEGALPYEAAEGIVPHGLEVLCREFTVLSACGTQLGCGRRRGGEWLTRGAPDTNSQAWRRQLRCITTGVVVAPTFALRPGSGLPLAACIPPGCICGCSLSAVSGYRRGKGPCRCRACSRSRSRRRAQGGQRHLCGREYRVWASRRHARRCEAVSGWPEVGSDRAVVG